MNDEAEILDFLKTYPFAVLITAKDNIPTATHLPFVVASDEQGIVLTSHFAKANPQWQHLQGAPALVIFSEPHAYISPRHYDGQLNVPTWNYMAVHAYGNGSLVRGQEESLEVLEHMIACFEPDYKAQWTALPGDYKAKMLKGITVFRIRINKIEAKQKLSQNKSKAERHRIIGALEQSSRENEQAIAAYMKGRTEMSNR